MRVTINLPEDLYRSLKARARVNGLTLPQLVRQLIEQGLPSPAGVTPPASRHAPPPVIIPCRGVPIPALSREELMRMEEDDEAERAEPA
jgi:hypothetical protein